jgi:hypothetical protein
MTLEELFKRLSFGPFSNIAIGNSGAGTILEAKKPAIVDYLNDGLLRLYSRFILKENEVVIEERAGTTLYVMSSANAVSNQDTDPTSPGYILDTEAEPFQNDLLKILAVYDSDGNELVLNREGDELSLFTPQPNILQIPAPTEGKTTFIIYQARQNPLPLTAPVDLNLTFEIPAVLEQALISYIAYKAYSAINSQEATLKAKEHLEMYDAICMEAIENDLVNTSLSMANEKLDDRGFI